MKKAGRRIRTEYLEVRSSDSLLSHARVAVIVGKHGHTIVERNQLRRRLREMVRTRLIPVMGAADVVVRSLPSAYELSYVELLAEFEKVIPRVATTTKER